MRCNLLIQEQPPAPQQSFYCLIQAHSATNIKKYISPKALSSNY